jgi:hypothetical protein
MNKRVAKQLSLMVQKYGLKPEGKSKRAFKLIYNDLKKHYNKLPVKDRASFLSPPPEPAKTGTLRLD